MLPLEILLSSIDRVWIGSAADYPYRVGVPVKVGIWTPQFSCMRERERERVTDRDRWRERDRRTDRKKALGWERGGGEEINCFLEYSAN